MEEELKQRVLAVPLDEVPLFLARLAHYLAMQNRAIVNPYLADHLRGEDADLRGHWLNELTFRATQQLIGTLGPNPTFGYPYDVFADTLFEEIAVSCRPELVWALNLALDSTRPNGA